MNPYLITVTTVINLFLLNERMAEAKEVCTNAKLRIKIDKFKSITDAHLINKAKKILKSWGAIRLLSTNLRLCV